MFVYILGVPAITFWLLGSLSGMHMAQVWVVAPVVLVGCSVLYLLRWRLNVLSLPEAVQRAL